MRDPLYSNKLVVKLLLAFLSILILAGVGYMGTTMYLSNNYFYETTQRLHANLAQDLIDEKFSEAPPFDENGAVNKALFGDIMHDMMAVNRAIEVYLLNSEGKILYSVVLDHTAPETNEKRVALEPIDDFISQNGQGYFLGDNPKNPDSQSVFSAAEYNVDGQKGYVYIVLAGEDYATTRAALTDSYFVRLGFLGSLLTLVFTAVLAFLSIWYLTKNLRELVYAAKRFQQGDLHYRIEDAASSDLVGVAQTYNEMADTILKDMEKIKSLETMRRELIANVSHDLRTPLSVIQGYVETLQIKGAQLDTHQRDEYLNTINRGCERLSKLISQLFEYSKLEANQIEPQKEPFLISELANDIHANYRVLAEQWQIDLRLEMDSGIPLVFADISLVERAIQNLMDNALKFTPQGGEVIVKIIGRDKNVEIIIKDSGPGITKANQALIFDRYRQTKSGQQKEGSGLGLAIVKRILELHNASIEVFSTPNEGASFSFSLPVYHVV